MHQTNTLFIFVVMLLMLNSCINPYEPNILASDAKKYVVSGQVNAGDEVQTVNISTSSPLDDPEYLPVTECVVRISDNQGHEFLMEDSGDGNYTASIDQALLQPGVPFRIQITTPSGEEIASEFDTIRSCAQLDSVYYIRKDVEGNDPGVFKMGIQFYIDFSGTDSDSRNYRWDAIETWEYHTVYPREWYYDGVVHHVVPPDYSHNVCWTTAKVPTIFTLTTSNLQENQFELFPIHYVGNQTTRLEYGYSLLVKQYALSEAAYLYWEQQSLNSNQEGGLYTKQPLAVKGNMHNLTHPEQDVLGFFGATSVQSKRIFVKDVPDLPLTYPTYCDGQALRVGLREIPPSEYPGYLLGDEMRYYPFWLNKECVECERLGGTIVKPDFWPF